jgi:hypothetical protein
MPSGGLVLSWLTTSASPIEQPQPAKIVGGYLHTDEVQDTRPMASIKTMVPPCGRDTLSGNLRTINTSTDPWTECDLRRRASRPVPPRPGAAVFGTRQAWVSRPYSARHACAAAPHHPTAPHNPEIHQCAHSITRPSTPSHHFSPTIPTNITCMSIYRYVYRSPAL